MKDTLKHGLYLFFCSTIIIFCDFIFYIFKSNTVADMDLVSWIYYSIASLGHASLLSFIFYILLYFPPALLFKNKKVASVVFTVSMILIQIVLLINSFVFSLYKFHINGFVLELVFGGAATEIFVFDASLYLKFFIIIFLFAILPFLVSIFTANKKYKSLKPKQIKIFSAIFLLCIVISHIGYAVAHAKKIQSVQKSATNLPLFFPLTANKALAKLGIIKLDELDNINYNKLSSDIDYPKNPIKANDSIPNYNIVYIVIDSWNPSTFNESVTPNIYNFSKKGNVFNNHISSSHGTKGSIFSIFFGLPFTYEHDFSISKVSPLFVDRLIDLKYDFQIYASADFTNPPFNEIIFRRVPGIRLKSNAKDSFGKDNEITDEFVKFINTRNSDKPFFSLLFYDLPHAISIPEEHRKKFQPSWDHADYTRLNNNTNREEYFNLYKNVVHYDDKLVGTVLKELEKKNMLDNTVVIITGDHGQEFNENKKNYWGHSSNYSQWQIKIPFVLYYPGIENSNHYNHTTTHYDIVPTMMERFLGVKNNPEDYSMGYDIYKTNNRIPHVVGDKINYGFLLQNVIVTTGHTGGLEITDYKLNEVDRSNINMKELQKAIEKKNMFYKK